MDDNISYITKFLRYTIYVTSFKQILSLRHFWMVFRFLRTALLLSLEFQQRNYHSHHYPLPPPLPPPQPSSTRDPAFWKWFNRYGYHHIHQHRHHKYHLFDRNRHSASWERTSRRNVAIHLFHCLGFCRFSYSMLFHVISCYFVSDEAAHIWW